MSARLVMRAGALALLLSSAACAGEMRPLPREPRNLYVPGSIDGKPIDDVLASIVSGRIPADKLQYLVKREPQLAKAFASEQLVIRCLRNGQYASALYLAHTWAILSGATLSEVVSAAGALQNEQKTLVLLGLLEAECPSNCALQPNLWPAVAKDWRLLVGWVAQREHDRSIWNSEDYESGALLLNNARSREMAALLMEQGARARSREEIAAYLAERRQQAVEAEAEEREYQAEREAREAQQAELERLEQEQREQERLADAEASERTRTETWNNINDKLDNLVSETRAQNEAIVANTRDAYEQAAQQREAAEAQQRAQAEEREARAAEIRERYARDAEERERAAAEAAEARAQARADAATAATASRTTVINNPFSAPAVSISQGGMMPSSGSAGASSTASSGSSGRPSSSSSSAAAAVAAVTEPDAAPADAPPALHQAHQPTYKEPGCRVYASLHNATGTLALLHVCIRDVNGWGDRLNFVYENLSDVSMIGPGHAQYRTKLASGIEQTHSSAMICFSDGVAPGKTCKAQQFDTGKDRLAEVQIFAPIASFAVGKDVHGHPWDFYGQVVMH